VRVSAAVVVAVDARLRGKRAKKPRLFERAYRMTLAGLENNKHAIAARRLGALTRELDASEPDLDKRPLADAPNEGSHIIRRRPRDLVTGCQFGTA